MVIYCVLNPDAKHPFYLDAILAKNQLPTYSKFDILKFVDKKLRDGQKPVHSEKYAQLREKEELKILSQIYEECTSFNPSHRMTANQVVTSLARKDDHLQVIPLKVSQNSAMERYDMEVAARGDDGVDSLPLDDAVNACSFISVVLGDLILFPTETTNCDLKRSIIKDAERSITDLPIYFNPYRNAERLYDVQEAYTILRQANVIGNDYQLSEEILTSACLYSESGRRMFIDAMENLQDEVQTSHRKASVAVYTFDQYVLLIGCAENKFFLVDSHPVVEDDHGNHTGVVLFTDGHSTQSFLIYDWLVKRFKDSGVSTESMQSFAILK